MSMTAIDPYAADKHSPPWAKACKNPFIRHDWDWIPPCYEPEKDFFTRFDADSYFNQRCTVCRLVCCRMFSENGTRMTKYDESTRPKDYKYTELEEPTLAQYAQWYIETAQERHERRGRRQSRQTKAQRGKQAA